MHVHPVARCTGSLPDNKAVLMTPEVTATTSTTALQHYSTTALQHCCLPGEHISRLYGTFDQWTHVSCNFNFETKMRESLTTSLRHAQIRNDGARGHSRAVVLPSLRKPCQRQDRRSGLMHFDAIWCLQNLTKVVGCQEWFSRSAAWLTTAELSWDFTKEA